MITSNESKSCSFIVSVAAAVFCFTVTADAVAAGGFTIAADRLLVVADAHTYRHCHNLSKRTYCHKADRLPQNWPPNSDTPHRGYESDSRRECPAGSRKCADSSRYGQG